MQLGRRVAVDRVFGDSDLMRIRNRDAVAIEGELHGADRIAARIPPVGVGDPGAGADVDGGGRELRHLDPDRRLAADALVVGEDFRDQAQRLVDVVVVVDREEQVEAAEGASGGVDDDVAPRLVVGDDDFAVVERVEDGGEGRDVGDRAVLSGDSKRSST